MWSYLILKMIITFLNAKEELEDVRSDDEDEWDEDNNNSNSSENAEITRSNGNSERNGKKCD